MLALQRLYEELCAAFSVGRPRRRGSGLTMSDHVGAPQKEQHAWCAQPYLTLAMSDHVGALQKEQHAWCASPYATQPCPATRARHRRSGMPGAAQTRASSACFWHSRPPQATLSTQVESLAQPSRAVCTAAGRKRRQRVDRRRSPHPTLHACGPVRAGGRASSAAAARPCTRGRRAGCTCGAAWARARPCSWTCWRPARRRSSRRGPRLPGMLRGAHF